MQDIEQKIILRRPISELPPVKSEHWKAFEHLGIHNVATLLKHLPYRYETILGKLSILEATKLLDDKDKTKELITIEGVVSEVNPGWRRGKKTRITVLLEDETGEMTLNWFNQPWIAKKLHPEMKIRVFGALSIHKDKVQMNNPRWENIDDSNDEFIQTRNQLMPVYPTTEGLHSTTISNAINSILSKALIEIDDHFTPEERRNLDIIELNKAYQACHKPQTMEEVEEGRRRIAFDELFLIQLGVMMKRQHRINTQKSTPLKWSNKIKSRIGSRIHFALTAAQQSVIDEIAADVTTTIPMNRLLQGDVGSGKTVVALHAMLMAVTSNTQAAMMAPTELLAEQHFKMITSLLAGSKVNVALLTSSLNAKSRASLAKQIAGGEIDIIIGTHAILTNDIVFNNIAIVITDEQHRFGVHQRAKFRNKNENEDTVPHTLVMTATPIPRTLSLTQFGDLDVSTINALPPGRKPIKTKLIRLEESEKAYQCAAEHLRKGHQCYVVVPLVEESESGMKSVYEQVKFIQEQYFSDFNVQGMHGRMKLENREATMKQFNAGKIDVLVATTVIEVGVDVPNATIMIIEHAERFGLAQLHQLRGRVGRGSEGGTCIMVANATTEDSKKRLDAIVNTNDGFKIAEQDLIIRGPGELFGSKQSGMPPLRIAQLPKHNALLLHARKFASQIIQHDAYLESKPLLRARLIKAHGESLGLGDVA